MGGSGNASGGKNGVTTTICGHGESVEELSSISLAEGDDMEMAGMAGMARNNESEEALRKEGGWDLEVPMGRIHKSIEVHISEEHIGDPETSVPIPFPPMVKRGTSAKVRGVDLDGTGSEHKEFNWAFEEAGRR